MAVNGGSMMSLTPSEAWTKLSEPVLVLAEELALRRAATAHPPLTLVVSAGGVDAVSSVGGRTETMLSVPGRPQLVIHDVVSRLAGVMEKDVAMAFTADQSVGQRIVLPQQPAEVLKAIVRNKVESLAPWPLAQCMWGMRVVPAEGEGRHVAVDVAVISRAVYDDLAAALRKAGVEVKALSVALPDGNAAEIELDGGDVRRAARQHAARLAKATASAVLLLLVAGAWWIFSTSSQASRLEAQSATLMAALKPGGVPAGEPPQITAANRIQQLRRERPPALAVLEELSKLLPDSVHLVTLNVQDEEVTINGQGSGVPALIEILEASPVFQNVNFAAATEADQNGNADSFSIRATLERPGAPGAAP